MPDTVTHIQTIAQPVEVSVKVGMEIDSKGQRKPSVEIKITRHIGIEAVDRFYGTLMDDLQLALSTCKETIKIAMEEK